MKPTGSPKNIALKLGRTSLSLWHQRIKHVHATHAPQLMGVHDDKDRK
jgi:hypothetical protein